MRCYCCDHILTPTEATRRFKESNSFTEMCNQCINAISDEGLEYVEGEATDDELFDEDGNPKDDE